MRKNKTICALLLLGGLANAYGQNPHAVDPERSVVSVKVYKAGLLGGFGHDHDIEAPIMQGTVDEGKGTVELVVDTRQLKVMDTNVSQKDRVEIQENMDGPKVLDVEHFPRIRFHSTASRPVGQNKWRVEGQLEIHGQTRPVTLEVERYAGLASPAARYRGSLELRQTDFGIRPFSSMGGTIKVKDKILVRYDVVVRVTPEAGGSNPGRHRN